MATANAELKPPLVVIVGPTASGKTALGVAIARRFNGEVICADSRTIYKYMDIGTAKPSVLEQQGIPHHLLDVTTPDKRFTVADFQHRATNAIHNIHERGKLPILVGGSGMYIDSILYDYTFSPINTPRDTKNQRHLSSDFRATSTKLRDNTLIIGIDVQPDILEDRIAERIDRMFKRGLVEEARILGQLYGWDIEPMKTYLPILEFLGGTCNEDQAKQKMIIKDRQLAKKQRTWFRRNISIQWTNDPSKIVDLVTTFLNKQS